MLPSSKSVVSVENLEFRVWGDAVKKIATIKKGFNNNMPPIITDETRDIILVSPFSTKYVNI